MKITCNRDALHEMSNPFLLKEVGLIFDPLTLTTFRAKSAYDKLVIVIFYSENRV